MTYTPGIPSGLFRTLMRGRWSPLVDQHMGETLLIKPMRRDGPNVQQVPDPSRATFSVAGVFRAPREPIPWGQGEYQKQNISLDKPCFSIALAALPYPLRRGDLIVRCEINQTFEIKAMKSDALHIRGLFEVCEMGTQEGLGGPAYA